MKALHFTAASLLLAPALALAAAGQNFRCAINLDSSTFQTSHPSW